TGAARVAGLQTLRFLPGAMADHLTSAGGALTGSGSGQMSALRWLEAGATASYGTVVEPCNLPQKFPDPAVAIGRYLAGDTLIEAYWKSVRMPGQGVFVGEPLAAPFAVPR
ncbi:MAG: TIGR03790 family protein, partial [Burkholderiales bacterium]